MPTRERGREGASLCVEWSDSGGNAAPPSALSLPVRACFLTWAGVGWGAGHLVKRLPPSGCCGPHFPRQEAEAGGRGGGGVTFVCAQTSASGIGPHSIPGLWTPRRRPSGSPSCPRRHAGSAAPGSCVSGMCFVNLFSSVCSSNLCGLPGRGREPGSGAAEPLRPSVNGGLLELLSPLLGKAYISSARQFFLILNLQIGKLPREVKTLASDHTAAGWLSLVRALTRARCQLSHCDSSVMVSAAACPCSINSSGWLFSGGI